MSNSRLIVTGIFLVAIGWLYFSPPSFNVTNGPLTVTCRPLGLGFIDEVSVLSTHNYGADRSEVSHYADEQEKSSGFKGLAAEVRVSVAASCNEARMNRQTDLFLVVAAGMVVLYLKRTRHAEVKSAQQSTPTEGEESI
ncbi:hypothetical protein G7066_14505 [Leucobacter coleopterorum]|uniref:Uncharacterized protein n=1 Tax=Leucobacter coleopterorum TaxID=2714933 RepID=A0ABX6JYT7_9MICO|nr:hypothetical protein [Leucobacter coleopterorum]QIM19482.1 hypothetical protein G7066_14505 [Leucobacter coleopterorum]